MKISQCMSCHIGCISLINSKVWFSTKAHVFHYRISTTSISIMVILVIWEHNICIYLSFHGHFHKCSKLLSWSTTNGFFNYNLLTLLFCSWNDAKSLCRLMWSCISMHNVIIPLMRTIHVLWQDEWIYKSLYLLDKMNSTLNFKANLYSDRVGPSYLSIQSC